MLSYLFFHPAPSRIPDSNTFKVIFNELLICDLVEEVLPSIYPNFLPLPNFLGYQFCVKLVADEVAPEIA